MKEKTQAIKNKEEYLASGNKIPTCVNDGCENNVVVRDWKYYSFKHQCSNCTKLQQNNRPPPKGVTFSKKNYCENKDSRLGYKCPVDTNFKFPYSVLHGDHINGNHEDNRAENIQTFCSICHHLKGLKSGDFISAKKGRKLS
tara:strand:+ start:434 stop:859 length:426 start_codon:yes stop_codon:yes gene_type:complete